jgi:hypothetical protein
MFTWQKDNSEFIYHYTKAETAIEFILKDERLRFSPFMKTNDPKESKKWFFIPGSNRRSDLSSFTPESLSNTLHRYIQESTQLVCFSKDGKLTGNHLEDNPHRGFCKPRMWDQYGGRHAGVCLIFDVSRLSSIFHEKYQSFTYKSGSVSYADRLLPDIQLEPAFTINVDSLEEMGPKDYALAHVVKYQERMFFEKAKDWENEAEFRFVIFECEPREHFLEYGNALRGVLFGESCSEETVSKVVALTRSKGLAYQKLLWRNCTPWFDFSRTY